MAVWDSVTGARAAGSACARASQLAPVSLLDLHAEVRQGISNVIRVSQWPLALLWKRVGAIGQGLTLGGVDVSVLGRAFGCRPNNRTIAHLTPVIGGNMQDESAGKGARSATVSVIRAYIVVVVFKQQIRQGEYITEYRYS